MAPGGWHNLYKVSVKANVAWLKTDGPSNLLAFVMKRIKQKYILYFLMNISCFRLCNIIVCKINFSNISRSVLCGGCDSRSQQWKPPKTGFDG